MPRILFTSLSDGLGGLELQMAKKTKDALKFYDSGILLCKKDSKLSDFAKKNSIPISEPKQSIPYLPPILILKLRKLIDKEQIDTIVCGKSQELSIAIMASKLSAKKPKVFFYQQMQSGIVKKDLFHNWIYKNITGAIVISEFMVNQLIQTTNIKPDKIELIPIGIDINKFFPSKEKLEETKTKLNLSPNNFLIIYVARFDQHKDQLTLIKAFAEAGLPDCHLILIGDNTVGETDYLGLCKKMTDEKNLADKITFLGFRDDLAEIFRASDLFVIPSRSETLGMVVLEAMASGLPVIGTNSGGIPDIITHNKNGLLFEPREYKTLSDLILELYHKKEKRESIAKNGLEKVCSNYNEKIQTQKFFEFITQK